MPPEVDQDMVRAAYNNLKAVDGLARAVADRRVMNIMYAGALISWREILLDMFAPTRARNAVEESQFHWARKAVGDAADMIRTLYHTSSTEMSEKAQSALNRQISSVFREDTTKWVPFFQNALAQHRASPYGTFAEQLGIFDADCDYGVEKVVNGLKKLIEGWEPPSGSVARERHA